MVRLGLKHTHEESNDIIQRRVLREAKQVTLSYYRVAGVTEDYISNDKSWPMSQYKHFFVKTA